MKLLNVENTISANSPAIARTAASEPRRSNPPCASVAAARTSSGMRSMSRCPKASAVSTRATTIVQPMPSSPTDSPESTEVTMNISPCTMPTSPLALARRSGSMRMVTVVDSAMLRMFSTTAPTRMIA